MNIKRAYKLHSHKRAIQRYGIDLSKQTRKEILEMIRTGQSGRNKKLTNTRTLHEVKLNGNTFFVVYSKTVKEIVTCLEQHHAERIFNV